MGQELGGNAAPVQAGAAQVPLFHKEHAAAHAGGLKRRGAARGSASQYREIEALFRHVQPTLLAWGLLCTIAQGPGTSIGPRPEKRCFQDGWKRRQRTASFQDARAAIIKK
jgi:hypothetical protein